LCHERCKETHKNVNKHKINNAEISYDKKEVPTWHPRRWQEVRKTGANNNKRSNKETADYKNKQQINTQEDA